MPLTLMPLTTMAEPGTMLTSNFFLEVGWVSGDAGAIYPMTGRLAVNHDLSRLQ